MDKNGYKELDKYINTITEAVNELQKSNSEGKKVYVTFNCVDLFSDTVTLDSAYMAITGKTKEQCDEAEKKWKEDYAEQKRKHREAIPELIEFYKNEARGVIQSDKLHQWDEILEARLSDLYEGMELRCTIEIAKVLNKGIEYFDEAQETLNNQGHSGMSYGLMKSMIREFCYNGVEFVTQLKY